MTTTQHLTTRATVRARILQIVAERGSLGTTSQDAYDTYTAQYDAEISRMSATQHLMRMHEHGDVLRLACQPKSKAPAVFFATQADMDVHKAVAIAEQERRQRTASTPGIPAERHPLMPAPRSEISGLDICADLQPTVATLRPPVPRPGSNDHRACPSRIGDRFSTYSGSLVR